MHKIPLMLTEGDVRRDEMWWCTPSQQGGAVCHRGLKEQRAWRRLESDLQGKPQQPKRGHLLTQSGVGHHR